MTSNDGLMIAPKVKDCIDFFNKLLHVSDEKPDAKTALDDHIGRFNIWAGNVGAFQAFSLPISLDYRLREAPKITEQIRDPQTARSSNLEPSFSHTIAVNTSCKCNRCSSYSKRSQTHC